MPYSAPVGDARFLLEKVVGFDAVRETERFADATDDVTEQILTSAAKLCDEVLAPLQRNGDEDPARLENGRIRTSRGYAEGYRAIAEGGWIGISADPEHGGMGLPQALNVAVGEMMSGACLSLQLSPLLTAGQIEALEHHADAQMRAVYLPKLVSGEWAGTMNLSEPQAGSDVGAVATRAEPAGDGTYRVTGQKIWISWGDADFVDNVCHLVLARLPDAPDGTKGISLFMVPRNLPDESGEAGVANDVRVVSIEEKLGLHGSPTCVMEFGGAKAWLVGQENRGMAAMFTMMNNARLGVGVQGVGVAEAAYQHALAYATERKQGASRREGATGTIIDHADVRRMLATMRADTYAARAIALACAVAIDMARATGSDAAKARAALLTPIAKAFGTDTGIAVADAGIQIHGGMGYVEETGAAQFLRDVRVTAIYEGTNGIQAMDLVGRKLMDGGEAAFRLLDEIERGAEEARDSMPDLAQSVWEASETLCETTEWLVAQTDPDERNAGAVPYLRAFARVLGAHYHLKSARVEGGSGPRAALARFYIEALLPEHAGLCAQVRAGAAALFALSTDDLVA